MRSTVKNMQQIFNTVLRNQDDF